MKKDLLIIERNSKYKLTKLLSEEGYSILQAETAGAALETLKRHTITHAVILNALSLRTKGDRTCVSLKNAVPRLPILVYSDQEKPPGADMLIRPGKTTRKLVNKIEMYSPFDKKKSLCYGEICLDEKKQRVCTPNGIAHLNTKGAQILKYMIKKKGALVSKEELFTKIWKTAYFGDMNTLYTNISCLRMAIEEDPSSPRYLLTKRGKGYMLNGG